MEEGKEMATHCSSSVIEEKQGVGMCNNFPLLIDEEFDFDLSLSAASENEDEVFIGPLGHKEKCIAVNVEAKENAAKQSTSVFDDKLVWSPLTGEKYVEIFKEARLLALQLETGSKNEQTKKSQSGEKENKIVEKFVEDSKSKLKILRNEIDRSPRAIKRETYCVQGSPARQLLPCFQEESNRLVLNDDKTQPLHTPPNRSPVKTQLSPTKIASSPLTQEQTTKERNMKTTNKLPMAKPSSTLGKSRLLSIEKPKPGRCSSVSTKRDQNGVALSEEIVADNSSAASDVLESSFSGSSSAQDKKALPVPNKPGLKKITQLKLPVIASGLTRKTASSSSSVSSMNSSLNSSLPISPIGKNGKSSMSSKPSVKGSKLSSSINKVAPVRPTRVSSVQAANAEKSREQVRSASTPKISSTVSFTKSSASATTAEAVGSGIQRLSSVPSLQKVCQQEKDGSTAKGNLFPKPRPRVLSVSASQTTVPVKPEGTPLRKSAPKATPSRGTFGSAMAVSTPVKSSEDGVFQSFPERSGFLTPASVKRSGLPTPVRRVSGFSAVTPNTAPKMTFSPHAASVHRSYSFSTKKTSTAGKETSIKTWIFSDDDEISPPPVPPLALNFSPEETSTEAEKNKLVETAVQNQLTETRQAEALLVDIGLEPSLPGRLECERPLIDLSNTPEVNNVTLLKPIVSGQVKLIDLSSPLITLSPDVNKENLDSPLLKF
ncbi:GTSE1 protein, partial [Upupa epops]|nr:GTSE1 protein [Upupa epops]